VPSPPASPPAVLPHPSAMGARQARREAAKRQPKFTSLPAFLRFPLLEKYVLITFSPALLTSASSVIGAHFGGAHAVTEWSLILSYVVALIVVIFHVSEVWTLFYFHKRHHDNCWQGEDPPQSNAEVDDPLLALLGWLHVIRRPRLRGRGGFEAPEADGEEPARTERALLRAFCGLSCLLKYNGGSEEEYAGDILEVLPMWLDDAGAGKGVFFVAVQSALQLAIAVLTGLLFANPWQLTTVGGMTNVVSLIAFQVFLVVWVLMYTANDLMTQIDTATGYIFELTATCLVFAANVISQNANGDEDQIAASLAVAGVSAQLLVYSCFVPMFFTAYDSFVVPVVLIFWKSEVSLSETICQVIISAVLLPVTIASSFLGFSSGAGALEELVSATEGSLVGMAADVGGGLSAEDVTADDDGVSAKVATGATAAVAVTTVAVTTAPRTAAQKAPLSSSVTQKAPLSAAAKKRQKRQAYLERVRKKSSSMTAKCIEYGRLAR